MEDDIQQKSKTEKKKEVEKLQKLGEQLSKLPAVQLRRMNLPEDLKSALIDGQSITSNIAGRRHRQYIGVLMRDVDPEPIRHALLQAETDLSIGSTVAKETRQWIDRLSTGDSAVMEEFLSICPGLERQRLRQLVRNINKGKESGKTSKSRRTLEQLIKKSLHT